MTTWVFKKNLITVSIQLVTVKMIDPLHDTKPRGQYVVSNTLEVTDPLCFHQRKLDPLLGLDVKDWQLT